MARFRTLDKIKARWVSLSGHGLEHMTLEKIRNRISISGVIISGDDNATFGIWYQVFLNSKWQVKAVSVYDTNARWFIASSRKSGVWIDGDGQSLAEFDGCVDVDIGFSAMTKTLPIKRLKWDAGQARDLTVLYIDPALMQARCEQQHFHALDDGCRFHHEVSSRDISTIIEYDNAGLIRDYPKLFKRLD